MFNKIHCCTTLLLAVAIPTTALADFSFYLGVGGGGSRIERDDIDLNYKVVTTNVTVPSPEFPAGGPSPYEADPFFNVSNPSGTDFAWKVFAGTRYGSNFGLEAAYLDLGEADDSFGYVVPPIAPVGGQPQRPETDRQVEVLTAIDGFTVSAIGFLPVGERFELFGKVGLIRWDRATQVLNRSLEFTPIQQPFVPDTRLYSGDRDPITGGPLQNFVLSGEGQNLFTCFPSPISDGNGGSQQRPLDAQCADLLPKRSDSGTDLALGLGVNIKASESVALRAEFEWFDIDGSDLTYAATVSLVFSF